MIQANNITIISEYEADLSRNLLTETFYTTYSLKGIKADTSNDEIKKLKTYANEEVFELAQSGLFKDQKVKLHCYLRSKKNKNPKLNTDY